MELKLIKEDEEKEFVPQKMKVKREDMLRLMKGWRILMGVPDGMAYSWTCEYYPQYSKSLARFIRLFGDWETAWDCIEYVANYFKKEQLSFTLETIWKRTDLYMEVMGKRGLK